MKISINQVTPPPMKFPRLMKGKASGDIFLVLGFSENHPAVYKGVALSDGAQFKAGELSNDLSAPNLESLDHSITLIND